MPNDRLYSSGEAPRFAQSSVTIDMKSELAPAVSNVALRGLTLASKFILLIALARYFQPSDLGIYGLMVSSVAITVFILSLEYKYFSIRALIGRAPQFQATIIRDQGALYAVVAAIVLPLLAVAFWSGLWIPFPSTMVLWFFALVAVELVAQEAGNVLIALSRPLAANIILFLRSGAWIYPIIVLAVGDPGSRTVTNILLAWITGAIAAVVVAAWCVRGLGWRTALDQPVDWAGVRAGVRTAAPFMVIGGASLGLLFFDRFVLDAYHGLELVGVYTFFAGIATALHTLVNTGVSLIRMPRLVDARLHRDQARFLLELRNMWRLTAIVACALAVLMAFAIVPVLQLVGRSTYRENLDVFLLLLGAALARSLADPPLYALYARHRDVALLAVNASAFTIAAIANLVLIPPLDMRGASVAAVLGALTLLLAALTVGQRGDGEADHSNRDPLVVLRT
jgi:O-antigen/teichoic acid export membrane protein